MQQTSRHPHTVPTGHGLLAYLITFTTYGTRLHGDDRGSVDSERNIYGTATIAPNDSFECWAQNQLKETPFLLDRRSREIVDRSLFEIATCKDWFLLARNVRTNHIHLVITATSPPEPIMNAIKSWATKKLKENGMGRPNGTVWTKHESTGHLWKPEQFEAACRYVVELQGEELI